MMKINGFNGTNTQTGAIGMAQANDSVSKNIQNQIANAQQKLQDLSSNEELSLEDKMKKRQEIQQEITNLNQQLRQHQIEQRKEQQSKKSSMDDMVAGTKNTSAKKGTGLSQAGMRAMISADSSMKQAKVQGSMATQMEGRAGVLESEIKQDAGKGNTEKKEEELADLQAKAQSATAAQMSSLSDANKSMEEAAKTDNSTDAADNADVKTETEETIKDSKEPKKLNPSKKGLVEFKNVSFRYPDSDEEVLSDISFTAEPGKTTAIIGSTGSGKSTIVNLIPRFYDVTSGNLLIDGVDIKDISNKDLRKIIGFVPQKGILFSGTIESNIKYGNPDMSDEQMIEAAQIAQATEFIESKPEKYQEPIAQGGSNVSGGQKQRLSIARAIAIDPEILVFDDSFSALDFKTDSVLRAELAKKTQDKTVIIVAQRINTILNADQIIVLEDGKVVGKGTHEELIKNNETYKQIALSQLSAEELNIQESNVEEKLEGGKEHE
mgnify:CR=1 FL=1